MKFNQSLILLMAASLKHAMGSNLRHTKEKKDATASFRMTVKDERSDSGSDQRGLIEGSDYSVASIVGQRNVPSANERDANIDSKKKQSRRNKLEQMKKAHHLSDHTEANPQATITIDRKDFEDDAKKMNLRTHTKNSNFGINIVGGQPSNVGDFPYFVDMGGCGGTLIAPDVVLGAAHCGGYIGETVRVSATRTGSTANGAIAVKVVAQVRHPGYSEITLKNDFYLYKLEREVFPTSSSITLSLNTNESKPSGGQELTVLGMGLTSKNAFFAPTRLRDVVVPALTNQQCSQSYGSEYHSDVMLCAGETGKDSCQGDSGGPIVLRNGSNHELVGVVSWGTGCGSAGYPGVYARVSSVIPWIQSVACDSWNSQGTFCNENSDIVKEPEPTPAPVPESTPPPGPTTGCAALLLEFKTDDYPHENAFLISTSRNGVLYNENNFEASRIYKYEACIETGDSAILQFEDSYGDGLSGDGYLRVEFDNEVLYNGWDLGFGYEWTLNAGRDGESNPVPAPAPAPVPQPDCIILMVDLRTDDYPEETKIVLSNDVDGTLWDERKFDANKDYTVSTCLRTDICTILDVTDTFGDGLLNDGYIRVTWDGTVLYEDWDIGSGFYVHFGDGC